MYYLYGIKDGTSRRLVAAFDSEQQMLTYVRWATLKANPDGTRKFEQGTPLIGFTDCETSPEPLTDDDVNEVPLNPTPSML
jgi:hypothetical protein